MSAGFLNTMVLAQAMGNSPNSNPAHAYLLGRAGGLSSNSALGYALMSSMNNNQSYSPTHYQSMPPQPEPAQITYITSTEEPTENTTKRRAAQEEAEEIDAELLRMEKRKKKLALQLEIDHLAKRVNEDIKKHVDEAVESKLKEIKTKEQSIIETTVRKTIDSIQSRNRRARVPFVRVTSDEEHSTEEVDEYENEEIYHFNG